MAEVGIVAIGRNEDNRLKDCRWQRCPQVKPTYPVDSGSTDANGASCVSSKSAEVYAIWKFGTSGNCGAPMQLIEHG